MTIAVKNNKALIYTGIGLAAIGLGFLTYRIVSRWNRDVVQGEYNTFLVQKDEPEQVEEVLFDEDPTEVKEVQNWSGFGSEEELNAYLSEFEAQSGFGDY